MKAPLEYGKYYHIFNRGNNYENIFCEVEDYKHFLDIYEIYISPIADTFAWCLMKNHFHILVRIKDENEIGFLNAENAKSEDASIKWKTFFPEIQDKRFKQKPKPTQQFKHLFNAYARWFNIRHNRISSLFEKNYERILVNHEKQFKNLILYIHNNPVKHGFVEDPIEYPWTSYLDLLSENTTKLMRDEVINYFDDIENFKFVHFTNSENCQNNLEDLILE